jgi:hypothetical protein
MSFHRASRSARRVPRRTQRCQTLYGLVVQAREYTAGMRWACALMLSGCSYLGMHGPMRDRFDPQVDCKAGLPATDAAGAFVFGGLATIIFVATRHPRTAQTFDDAIGYSIDDAVRDTGAGGAAVIATLLAASAVYGFYDVHACNAQIADDAASMQNQARAAARSGRCDDVVLLGNRLAQLGRDLDLRDPETRACFAYFCAAADDGFCACSQNESDCDAAVSTGLARSCVPSRVDVCVATAATRSAWR